MVSLHGADDPLRRLVAKPLSPRDFEEFRRRTEQFLRLRARELRPLDPALAAAVITRATEALVYGMSRDEPEWLRHTGFVDEVTELVVGYLAPRSSTPKPPRSGSPSPSRAD